MATRHRKPVTGKMPTFKLTPMQNEEEDLKKVKEQAIRDLEETQKKKEEWLDNELEKNLKNIK